MNTSESNKKNLHQMQCYCLAHKNDPPCMSSVYHQPSWEDNLQTQSRSPLIPFHAEVLNDSLTHRSLQLLTALLHGFRISVLNTSILKIKCLSKNDPLKEASRFQLILFHYLSIWSRGWGCQVSSSTCF